MPDIRERVLLPLYGDTRGVEKLEDAIDVAPLFTHLLLFETVILRSIRIADVAMLVRALGAEQTIELLDSGCIEIRLDGSSIGSFGSPEPIVHLINMGPADPEKYLSDSMQDAFGTLGLSRPVKQRLKLAVVRRRLTHSPAPEAFGLAAVDEALHEAVANSTLFRNALTRSAEQYGKGIIIPPGALRSELDGGKLRFDVRNVDAPNEVVMEVIRRACLTLARLNAEFGRMRRDNAVTALDDETTKFMDAKLSFLWQGNQNDPARRTATFSRVLEAVDLPSFDTAVRERSINVEQFLRVRASNECREFRAFVTQAERLDNDELRRRSEGLRAAIADAAQSRLGKVVRFLATSALGAALPVAGLAVSAIDAFVVDALFKRQGVVTFISKSYPSIFDKPAH